MIVSHQPANRRIQVRLELNCVAIQPDEVAEQGTLLPGRSHLWPPQGEAEHAEACGEDAMAEHMDLMDAPSALLFTGRRIP